MSAKLESIAQLINDAGRILLDQQHNIKLALCCILAQGHLLIQDKHGVGKTTLATTLAQLLGLGFKRVQFTSDLLPADIVGYELFNATSTSMQFMPGPIFTQLLLADEINRSSAKTQSALLEAMEERQVTFNGKTYVLERPFQVIATQNPQSQFGVYPLPESQLDRFLMCITLGMPQAQTEKQLLAGMDPRQALTQLTAKLDAAALIVLQDLVPQVILREPVIDYIYRLIHHTRQITDVEGVSVRGGMALKRAAQAYALIEGRDFVIPEDVQAVFAAVTEHRMYALHRTAASGFAQQCLQAVPVLVAS